MEKTLTNAGDHVLIWKHLHVRGENRLSTAFATETGETPPRTWRKLAEKRTEGFIKGNTSTYVEKTPGMKN